MESAGREDIQSMAALLHPKSFCNCTTQLRVGESQTLKRLKMCDDCCLVKQYIGCKIPYDRFFFSKILSRCGCVRSWLVRCYFSFSLFLSFQVGSKVLFKMTRMTLFHHPEYLAVRGWSDALVNRIRRWKQNTGSCEQSPSLLDGVLLWSTGVEKPIDTYSYNWNHGAVPTR